MYESKMDQNKLEQFEKHQHQQKIINQQQQTTIDQQHYIIGLQREEISLLKENNDVREFYVSRSMTVAEEVQKGLLEEQKLEVGETFKDEDKQTTR